MIEKYLRPGDKVELKPNRKLSMKNESEEKIYISKVNQILDEDQIEIMMPMEQSKMVLLPRNSLFNITVYTSKGLYQCEVKIGDRYKSGNVYLQVLELLTGIKRYQRREYYRYSCSVPIFCRTLQEEERETLVWDETIKGREGKTLDLGGGGARFLIEEEFQPEDLVICDIPLDIRESVVEIQGIGKILNSKPVKDTKFYEVRVQFEVMSNAMREHIIQYIFEDERKRRKHDNGL